MPTTIVRYFVFADGTANFNLATTDRLAADLANWKVVSFTKVRVIRGVDGNIQETTSPTQGAPACKVVLG